MGCGKSNFKREVYTNTILLQEVREITNKHPKLIPKLTPTAARKRTKPKVSRRKEIINTRAEINEIETKKTIERSNESKNWFFVKVNQVRTFSQTHQEKK